MSIGRCQHCGSEYFPGASDCPRCSRPVETPNVPYVEGGPCSAHFLGAGVAVLIAGLGFRNFFRALNGNSAYIWRSKRDWVVLQPEESWYWVAVLAWLVVAPCALYLARRHFNTGNSMGRSNAL